MSVTDRDPCMDHLPGFWDDANWNAECWAEYQRRRSEHGVRNWIEQRLHRLMGRFMGFEDWCVRETDQWPSTSGSYDPCEDHYNFLIGRGSKNAAAWLRDRARLRRPEFLS